MDMSESTNIPMHHGKGTFQVLFVPYGRTILCPLSHLHSVVVMNLTQTTSPCPASAPPSSYPAASCGLQPPVEDLDSQKCSHIKSLLCDTPKCCMRTDCKVTFPMSGRIGSTGTTRGSGGPDPRESRQTKWQHVWHDRMTPKKEGFQLRSCHTIPSESDLVPTATYPSKFCPVVFLPREVDT